MIDITFLLLSLSRGLFILLGLLTWLDFLRHRGRIRLDIALMFGVLGIISVIGVIGEIIRLPSWLNQFTSMLLMSHPYLLLRLVQHFRLLSRAIEWGAIAGMLISVLVLLLIPGELPLPLSLALAAYFVGYESYAAWFFTKGAATSRGVTRRRLILAAAGSIFLALAIFLVALIPILPNQESLLTGLFFLLAILSAISYYLGFAPPRWLRLAWQQAELQHFLHQMTEQPVTVRAEMSGKLLCSAAVRAVGAVAAVATRWDEEKEQLNFWASSLESTAVGGQAGNQIDQLIEAELHSYATPPPQQQASVIQAYDNGLANQLGAEALMVIPIATHLRQTWGVLFVFLRHPPLFTSDDLAQLTLMTKQCTFTLDYETLLEARRQAHQELERRVTERTAKLTAANAELEQFAYVVSHDLRAPLRAMKSYAQFLAEDFGEALDEFGMEYVTGIAESAELMDNLVVDLLEYSRIGRRQVKYQDVELSHLLGRLVNHLGYSPEEIHLPANAPTVQASAVRLEQIFANLLSNALKFCRQDVKPVVTIQCEDEIDAWHFSVRDNGIGIQKKHLQKIFGIFQRLHTQDEYEGTGVGLAIVKKAVEEHGGRIWVESEVGQGTTFTFSLPKKRTVENTSPEKES